MDSVESLYQLDGNPDVHHVSNSPERSLSPLKKDHSMTALNNVGLIFKDKSRFESLHNIIKEQDRHIGNLLNTIADQKRQIARLKNKQIVANGPGYDKYEEVC
jgi:phosphatidate phosphatase APP1